MKIEVKPFGGWEKCLHLSTDHLELVVTLEVGPRVIRCARPGEPNHFAEFARQMGHTGGEEWRVYGGHRFWHGPEDRKLTYLPDNAPVEWQEEGDGVRIVQPVENETGLQKMLHITLDQSAARSTVRHTLENTGAKPIDRAPWALSVMASGGIGYLPQEPFIPHNNALLPARPLVLWPYTSMADARFTWGETLIQIRQDPAATKPVKIGARNTPNWTAYSNGGGTFIKRIVNPETDNLPDMGCNYEIFTNANMLELETLGVMKTLSPGESTEHTEVWGVFEGEAPHSESAALAFLEERAAEIE